MQRLTNEMNFAESTFLLPAEIAGTDIRMRIFTPSREMPMAGHPTVGTTFALAHDGVIAPGRERWTFGLNVGPTPVALSWKDGALDMAWMDQGPPAFRPLAIPAEDVVDAIGADRTEWKATGWPVEEGSCGAAYFYVPLATRAAVDACEPDGAAMRRLKSAFPEGHIGVFVFSAQGGGDGATVYSRMFAPDAGVVEDPATGSASGPLGAYLVRHGVVAVAQRRAHRQRPGRQDGPSEPAAHPRRGDRCGRGHARPRRRCGRTCRRGNDRAGEGTSLDLMIG